MSRTRCSARRLSARSAPTKSSTNFVGRRHQQLGRRRVLGELAALLQDRDAVAHLDRLVDVVGDEDDRLAQLGLQAQELVLQPLAVDRVDRAERLVHEHQRRVGGERARDADALALAAGELRRVAVAHLVGVEADELEQLVDAGGDALPCPSRELRHGRDVLADRAVREQADLLDDVADLAPQLRRACGRVTLRPSSRMSPDVISIIRLTIRIAVVLPQPDGPTSTQISPAGTSSDSPSTAGSALPG